MINHVRTLLLNQAGSDASAHDVGYEYVPKDFVPTKVFPSWIQSIRNIVFGATPDVAMLNYRFRQLAPLLHSVDIAPYMARRDSRITYWPSSTSFFLVSHTPSIVVPNENTNVNFVYQDDILTTDSGKLEYSWHVEIQNTTPSILNTPTWMYLDLHTFSSSLTTPIPVTGIKGLSMQVVGTATAGDIWEGYLLKKPTRSLSDITTLLKGLLNDEVKRYLFGYDTTGDFATFRNWWENSNRIHFQLASVLIPLAYRIEEIRKA